MAVGATPRSVEAAGVRRDHVVVGEQAHLVAGEDAVADEAAGQPRGEVEDPGLDAGQPEGKGDEQAPALDDAEQPPHQLAEGGDLGAAELVDAGRRVGGGGGHGGLGHVLDVDRLEAGLRSDQRQDGHEAGHGAQTVEEAVVGAEDDRGTQDDGVGEGPAHRRLAAPLGGGIEAVAPRVGADGGDVDEAGDPFLGADPGDPAGAFVHHRLEGLPAGLGHDADAVDDRRGPGDGSARRGLVADVGLDRLDLADHPVGADEVRLVRPAHRHPHPPAGPRHALGDLAADEAGPAEDRDDGDGHGVIPRAGDP